MFFVYSYALAFWYGVKLIMDDRAYCIEDIKQCHIRYDPSSLLIGKKSIIKAQKLQEQFIVSIGSIITPNQTYYFHLPFSSIFFCINGCYECWTSYALC